MATKKSTADKKMEAKMKARQSAKVRPDEPVEETRIYLNMPKKKAPAKRKRLLKRKLLKNRGLLCLKEQKGTQLAVL